MFLTLNGGRIRRSAVVGVGRDTGFVIEQKTGDGWDRVQIPNAAAKRFARFILKSLGRRAGA